MPGSRTISLTLPEESFTRFEEMKRRAEATDEEIFSNALRLYDGLMLKAEAAGAKGGTLYAVVKYPDGSSEEEVVFG